MTREEAKRRMEICRDFLANNYYDIGEPNFTAFNMAIQALSQEPTDENLHREREQAYMQGYEDASKRFRQEPSVTHKSGKWIIRDDLSTVRYYQCSECNEIDLDISDYCPNCGAKMESEDKE